jgi:hypothetical protein
MISISITSTNYNGKTGEITFYSVNDPATPVNLGSHLIPYVRTDTDVYGTYILNFLAYSKTCTINLAVPTTTTTTTTAPTTTTTTTAAPALDVRLQTMVGSGYSGGITEGSYTFFQDDVSGNPIFSNGPQYIFWSLGCWYLAGEYTYHNASTPPDEPSVLSSISGSVSVLPTGLWTLGCPGNFPGFLDNFYTTVTAPTTTTTTAAPGVEGFIVSGAGDPNFNGTYCLAGTANGGPYWQKTDANGTYYIMYYKFNGFWFIQSSIDGGLDAEAPNYYHAGTIEAGPRIDSIWDGAYWSPWPAPSLTLTTCGGTTTTTTTPEPTTTTTTTAAPAGVFTLSGAGTSEVNGCYSEVGMYTGKPYYGNGTYFVWYEGYEFAWIISTTIGMGPPQYIGSDENNVPLLWNIAVGVSPAPALSQGC